MIRALLIWTLTTLFAGPLFAECTSCKTQNRSWTGHRAPNDLCWMCCGYGEVMAEALYLRPNTFALNYVIADPREVPTPQSEILNWLPQGKDRSIDPDHDWGFRVGLGYVKGCNDLRVGYTRLHSNQRMFTLPPNNGGLWIVFAHPATATLSPAFNPFFNGSPTEGIPAIATAVAVFDYDAADLMWAARTVIKCDLALRSALGLHFAYIDTTFADTWQGTEFDAFPTLFTEVITNRDHKASWGVGPTFGLDLNYPLACGFGFEAHIGGAMLVGDRKEARDGTRLSIQIPPTGPPVTIRDLRFDVHKKNHTVLFPYVTARLGLDYVWSCCTCFTAQIAFGYEFHSYINAIETFRFNDERATGQGHCDSFNLSGLYLRVRAVI